MSTGAATLHVKPRGRQCSHRWYLLTCEDYDALRARAQGRCEICRTSEQESPAARLVIDHDPLMGNWAVRGLLCNRCNSNLHRKDSPEATAYLANPWYVDALAERGLSIEAADEPGIGGRVCVAPQGAEWVNTPSGWRCVNTGHRRGSMTWTLLNRRYGPFNIAVIEPATKARARKEDPK